MQSCAFFCLLGLLSGRSQVQLLPGAPFQSSRSPSFVVDEPALPVCCNEPAAGMGGAICLEVTAVTSASAPATALLAVEVATHDERQPTPILPLCVTGRTTPTAVANVVQFVKTGSEPSNSSIMFNMICLTCAPDFPSRALAEHQLVDAPLITMPDDEVLW